jgi:3,4-dihydroxy 2-butanone 4-phosphate synthase / GTP cyclohydrolase II
MNHVSSIQAAIEAITAGRILIVVDSEERENEGDFLAAAQFVTSEMIHFMTSQGRGQLCMPVSTDIAERLDLIPMVARRELGSPCFTIPVDLGDCKTGISPMERARTIRAMLDPYSRPHDFVRPGHVFPLIAREGGVLARPGHTEASVDLTRLAGLAPAGVLCEICSRDGRDMARGEELWRLAEEFDLPIVTIDDLIEHRRDMAGSTEELALAIQELAGS